MTVFCNTNLCIWRAMDGSVPKCFSPVIVSVGCSYVPILLPNWENRRSKHDHSVARSRQFRRWILVFNFQVIQFLISLNLEIPTTFFSTDQKKNKMKKKTKKKKGKKLILKQSKRGENPVRGNRDVFMYFFLLFLFVFLVEGT